MKPFTAVVFCLVASSLRHCRGEFLSQRRGGRSGLDRILFPPGVSGMSIERSYIAMKSSEE